MKLNHIYCGDILTLDTIDHNSIDLVITSPPYNLGMNYGSDDNLNYLDYLEFNRQWMNRCFNWLKPDGRMCLNIPLDKNKGGQKSVYADLTVIAKDGVGFKYHSTVVWNEQNISRRTAWGSWMSASAPYVIAPVEMIVILYKQEWKKTSGSKKSDITRDEFMEWANGVWSFNGESKKKIGHPAPFPLELPRRCMKLFSYVGDTVLDPFMGSGTTALAALQNDRNFIGCDSNPEYVRQSEDRLLKEAGLLWYAAQKRQAS